MTYLRNIGRGILLAAVFAGGPLQAAAPQTPEKTPPAFTQDDARRAYSDGFTAAQEHVLNVLGLKPGIDFGGGPVVGSFLSLSQEDYRRVYTAGVAQGFRHIAAQVGASRVAACFDRLSPDAEDHLRQAALAGRVSDRAGVVPAIRTLCLPNQLIEAYTR